MKGGIRYTVVVILVFSALLVSAMPASRVWNFDRDQYEAAAQGFTDEVGRWVVVKDASAPSQDHVLAQLAKNSASTFNVGLARDTNLQDVDVAVSFKAINGRIDQGGGLVWRAKDSDNYYIARYNPLEDNYRVYKVVAGRRTELASADIAAAPGWHHLHVTMIGSHIRCYYDGKKYLDIHDETFQAPGQVGLWTKADARTQFDDFRVSAMQRGLRWESSYTSSAPEIDGFVDDVWSRSKPLTVEVREAVGGDNPRSVVLHSIHDDERVYILAQWPDTTRSDMRDPYVWNSAQNTYERPSQPDDQFALEFPLSGDFTVNMLALSRDFSADVWHWKAGRGNPVGWVDDKRHIISQKPIDNAREYSLGGHGKVYVARLADDGTPSYVRRDAPENFTSEVVDSFLSQTPSGSLADVRGKATHDGRGWTLEMSRRFNTHHADDATLNPSESVLCAIAVLDDELYWRHSVSPLLELRFLSGTIPAQ